MTDRRVGFFALAADERKTLRSTVMWTFVIMAITFAVPPNGVFSGHTSAAHWIVAGVVIVIGSVAAAILTVRGDRKIEREADAMEARIRRRAERPLPKGR